MGPSLSVNRATSTVQQNVLNGILQNNTTACSYTCQENVSGNVTTITNTRVRGNVDIFNLQCTTNVQCNLANSSTANLSSLLSANVAQKNTPASGGFGFSVFKVDADSDTSQYITNTNNQVTQITQSTCQATSTTTADNNFTVLTNVEIGGNLTLVNDTQQVGGNCTIQNISNAIAYNQDQANINQENLDSGVWSMIITGVIVLVLLGGVISILSTGIRGASSKKEEENLTPQQINEISNQLSGTETTPA